MSSEVEETLRRIQSRGPGAPARLIPLGRGRSECPSSKGYPRHKGVKGVLVVSANGTPIRKTRRPHWIGSNLESEQTTTYAALLSQLAMKASSVVRTLDETDELTFFRIRSLKHEIMIAPDKEYLLIVIQRPADS